METATAKGFFALQKLEGVTFSVSELELQVDKLLDMNQNFSMEVPLKLHIHAPALNRT